MGTSNATTSRLLIGVLTCRVAFVVGCGPPQSMRPIGDLAQAPLYTFNEWEIDAYLGWLTQCEPDPLRRAVVLARQNIGQPCRLYLLGEFPYELHDPDPLYCLSASDCVTFVEHTFALALSSDWRSFFQMLQRLRYAQGEIGLLTRNHFTEADWNPRNAWLFDDVTGRLGAATVPMHVRIDRRAFFARFGVCVDEPVEIWEDAIIPRGAVFDVLDRLRDGDVLEFVRGSGGSPGGVQPSAGSAAGSSVGPYVGHMGIALHDACGGATVVHSTRPAVREEPLEAYVARHGNIVGLKVLRMRPIFAARARRVAVATGQAAR